MSQSSGKDEWPQWAHHLLVGFDRGLSMDAISNLVRFLEHSSVPTSATTVTFYKFQAMTLTSWQEDEKRDGWTLVQFLEQTYSHPVSIKAMKKKCSDSLLLKEKLSVCPRECCPRATRVFYVLCVRETRCDAETTAGEGRSGPFQLR